MFGLYPKDRNPSKEINNDQKSQNISTFYTVDFFDLLIDYLDLLIDHFLSIFEWSIENRFKVIDFNLK